MKSPAHRAEQSFAYVRPLVVAHTGLKSLRGHGHSPGMAPPGSGCVEIGLPVSTPEIGVVVCGLPSHTFSGGGMEQKTRAHIRLDRQAQKRLRRSCPPPFLSVEKQQSLMAQLLLLLSSLLFCGGRPLIASQRPSGGGRRQRTAAHSGRESHPQNSCSLPGV